MTTELSTVASTPTFMPEAYKSEKAVALREHRAKPQKWWQRVSRGLSDAPTIVMGSALGAGFGLPILAGGVMADIPLLAASGAAVFFSIVPLSIAPLFITGRQDRKAVKAADSASDEAVSEFNVWLTRNYGLRLRPNAYGNYGNCGVSVIEEGNGPLMIGLETIDGGSTLEARLVEVAPGAFQIRKKEISDPSDSGHFKPLSAAVSNALTAQRAPTAITAGRE